MNLDSSKPLVGIATQGACVASGGFYVLYDEVMENSLSSNDEDEKHRRRGILSAKDSNVRGPPKVEWR